VRGLCSSACVGLDTHSPKRLPECVRPRPNALRRANACPGPRQALPVHDLVRGGFRFLPRRGVRGVGETNFPNGPSRKHLRQESSSPPFVSGRPAGL
jgi:hypothetical protein